MNLRRTAHALLLALTIFCFGSQFGKSQDAAPDPASMYLRQGQLAFNTLNYKDALKAFDQANKLRHGTCAECYFWMGTVKSRSGDFTGALSDSDKALSVATPAEDPLRISVHQFKAETLLNMIGSGNDPKKLKAVENEYRAALELGKDHPDLHLALGVTLLKERQDSEGLQELNTLLQLSPKPSDAEYARALMANPRHAGDEYAGDFEVHTLQGETVALHDLRGKTVVLDFWATWCPPCVASVPELKQLTKTYSRDQLVVISMSADSDRSKWGDFVAKKDMDWAQYWDGDGRIRIQFQVHAFPTYLVIDPSGFIRSRIIGLDPQKTVVAKLRDTLHTMLQENRKG